MPFSDEIEKKIIIARRRSWTIKQKPNTKKRLDNNWNYVKKWMTDRGCDCGEKNITKLSFHHLDPLEKKNYIRMICKYNMKKVLKELKKGVVKCKNCHTIIHAGTSKEREEILINQYFNKKPNKKWAYKNKLSIWQYKKSLSCIKCGINDPVILLFHHINSNLKNENISTMYNRSHICINQEITKTTCLCHNCHEDFHYIYGKKTNQAQLEQYLGKKVIPLQVDIRDYLPNIDQMVSNFYNLSFSII